MIWTIALLAASIAVYVCVLRAKLKAFWRTADLSARVEVAHNSFWHRVALRMSGIKTALIGFAGIFLTPLPDILDQINRILIELHQTYFAPIFSPETALKISTIIMLAIVVVHAFELIFAVKIEPKKD